VSGAGVPSHEADGGRDPDAEYFQAIEEFFVSRRGDPLFLSNADWLLIRKWRKAGLPLRVVQRGIADAMDSHDHSFARHRKVGSLRYCESEVAAAVERWQRALAGGNDASELGGVLEDLAEKLRAAHALGPHARAVADRVAQELMESARETPDARDVESQLRAAEAALVAAIERDTPEDVRRALDEEVDRDLGAYRERLPAKVLEQVTAESRTRRLLEAHGVPRLSLWPL
jgi:hypothetical protein